MVVKFASRPRPLFTCILESMCYKVCMLLCYTYSDVNKAVTEPRVNKKYEKVQIKVYLHTQKNEDFIRVYSISFHLWWNVTQGIWPIKQLHQGFFTQIKELSNRIDVITRIYSKYKNQIDSFLLFLSSFWKFQ